MTRMWMTAAVAALALTATVAQAAPPANVVAAMADKGRPAEEVARDAARKPGELLEFAGVKPGDKVVDLIMGGGYFTRLLSVAVGPKGQVIAYQPSEFIQFQAKYAEDQKKVAGAYANVTALTSPLGALALPDGVDLVLTVQNYHDLHLTPFPKDTAAKVNAAVFKSLKPGGVYLIVDHVAVTGSGLEPPMKVHRIDPAIIKQEVEAAGFKFEADSPLLKDAADPHTASVFDPAIRGKTDQVVLKFRKPK
ncbi:MAG: methyltransferase [Alphaproteobacteria bacterium]|nr:methyltransferase [Alphaproteobacteria bacterium]MBU1513331.1 methyltransferase [Alphaproteobacteria bacterium]MBU2096323.1 methyltransferase [Alphaproteobacteria bacterium]MBU2151620.1 methyltransferase [Alphaproteobacteria bacterium]MBU2309817.1 methyltransferase [Alphaproteobacteria bacterium]